MSYINRLVKCNTVIYYDAMYIFTAPTIDASGHTNKVVYTDVPKKNWACTISIFCSR